LARQILSYAALFDPNAIAKPWLETLIAEHHGDQLEHESFADAWRWLAHRRLVTPTDVAEVWRMHRLVRGYVEDASQPMVDRFNALIQQQTTALKARAISAQSVIWHLDVLVAWVMHLNNKHKLWSRITGFLITTFIKVKKFNLGHQLIERHITFLETLHLENPDAPKHTWAYANALELSALIQHRMGSLVNTNLLGQQVMALRKNLACAMPDDSRYVRELSQSTAYFSGAIAELNKLHQSADELYRNTISQVSSAADQVLSASARAHIDTSEARRALGRQLNEMSLRFDPMLNVAFADRNRLRTVSEELFRNAIPQVSSAADQVLRASARAHIDTSEARRALGTQLNEISSRFDPPINSYLKQNAALQRSLGAGLTNFYSAQNAAKSAFDQIQKQWSASSCIKDFNKFDHLHSTYAGHWHLSAAEARTKRREAKLEYAKFIRDGDSDCLESINDTFEHLREEKKYISNTDRRMWKRVCRELRGENDG
jgi:hypothetical protein